jgi:Uma2 family endonuclease
VPKLADLEPDQVRPLLRVEYDRLVESGDYSVHHPAEVHLVVDVATTSARRDRVVKAPLYARAGVPEYWIVEVESRTVRVCRRPAGAEFGDATVYGQGDSLRLLRFPDVEIAIRSILPTGA